MSAQSRFAFGFVLFGLAVSLPLSLPAQQNPPAAVSASDMPDAPSTTLAEMQATMRPGSGEQEPDQGADSVPQEPTDQKKQPARILWVIPNYRAVSSDMKVPPLTPHGKFRLMVDDSFDYSAFMYTGFVAGLRMQAAGYPQFGEGPTAYAQYYWRTFVDNASGNTFTEWLLPVAFKQDPRYFTKGHGSVMSRAGYAASRLLVTRSDKGTSQFNISEIAGNLAAAGISSAYYPANKRGVSNTMNNWVVQLGLDGAFDVMKEFWPDIAHKVLHQE
jgi:hypothetical protein